MSSKQTVIAYGVAHLATVAGLIAFSTQPTASFLMACFLTFSTFMVFAGIFAVAGEEKK